MNERELTAIFKKLLFQKCQEQKILAFYYKIPDTAGLGGLKPFDSFLLINGKFLAIEFKVNDRKLEKHQEYYLNIIKSCGGISLMINETNYKVLIDKIIKIAIITRNLSQQVKEYIKDDKDGLLSKIIKQKGGEINGGQKSDA